MGINDDTLAIIRAAFPAAEWVWPQYKDICGVVRPSPYVYSHQHGWSITVALDTDGMWRGAFDQRSSGNGVATTACDTLDGCLAQLRVQIRTERDFLQMILECNK